MAIRIEDSAEPVPMNSQEVFGHFHGGDEETLETRGSGLRFPILSAIVLGHGGAIDLAINERGGNLFFIRMPVREGVPDAEETAQLFGMDAAAEEAAAPVEAPPDEATLEGGPPAPGVEPMDLNALFATEPAPQVEPTAAPIEPMEPSEPMAGQDISSQDDVPPDAQSASAESGPTTDTILSSPESPETLPEKPAEEGALWDVPLEAGPVSLEALEDGTPGGEPAAPEVASPGSEPAAPEAASPGSEPASPASPDREQQAPQDDPKETDKPGQPFSFGSDEIILE